MNITSKESTLVRERKSNIELLRIISILLVMALHADYLALSPPSQSEISTTLGTAFARGYVEGLSCVCVNVFILISGWFGIHLKIRRIFELIFQIWFISFVVLGILWFAGLTGEIGVKEWINLLLMKSGGYWFVRAYLLLYIFSPILNAFVENSHQQLIKNTLISFYIMQTVFGFYNSDVWFSEGYSPLSFMGLYVLGRYMKLYPNKWMENKPIIDIVIFFTISAFTTVCALALTSLFPKGATIMFLYSSPFVITASIFLFLSFTKITMHSRVINWIATSSFAAYLVHCFHIFSSRTIWI